MKGFVFAFLCLALPTLSSAKTFSNSFISFDLPDGWDCTQEETEWVCRNHERTIAKESVIVFTAKEAGPTDTAEEYIRHLATPQASAAKSSGNPSLIISQPKKIVIHDQNWVESIHQSSEIKDYITRYLATVQNNLAVAFSFTSHKDVYKKYSGDFFKAAQTLKVLARPKGTTGLANNGGGAINVPSISEERFDATATPIPPPSRQGGQQSKFRAIIFMLAVACGAVAILILMRKRKK